MNAVQQTVPRMLALMCCPAGSRYCNSTKSAQDGSVWAHPEEVAFLLLCAKPQFSKLRSRLGRRKQAEAAAGAIKHCRLLESARSSSFHASAHPPQRCVAAALELDGPMGHNDPTDDAVMLDVLEPQGKQARHGTQKKSISARIVVKT